MLPRYLYPVHFGDHNDHNRLTSPSNQPFCYFFALHRVPTPSAGRRQLWDQLADGDSTAHMLKSGKRGSPGKVALFGQAPASETAGVFEAPPTELFNPIAMFFWGRSFSILIWMSN